MSLWICWRDTRVIVFAYLLGLIGVCWDILRHSPMPLGTLRTGIDGWHDFSLLWAGLGVASWLLGSIALQKDTTHGGTSVGLPSKQLRSFYVWRDSVVVLTEIIALTVVTMALFTIMYHFGLIFFGREITTTGGRSGYIPLSFLTVFLAGCSMTLFAGLLFSTSYLATVLTRRVGVGVFLAAVVFILYILLQREMQYLPGAFHPILPNWQLNPFDILISKSNVAPRLVSAILARAAIILLVLYAAQIAAVSRGSEHRDGPNQKGSLQP